MTLAKSHAKAMELAWTFPADNQHRAWRVDCWYVWTGGNQYGAPMPDLDSEEWIEITWPLPLTGTDPAERHGW